MSNLISNKVRKYFLGAFIALTLAVAPFVSQAITVAELQAQIAALVAQLQAMTNGNVPIVKSLQQPEISLTYGIPEGATGSNLFVRYRVSVTSQGADLYLPVYGLNATLINSNGREGGVAYTRNVETKAPLVNVPDRGSYYLIRKGETFNFDITYSYNVNHIFAGLYYSQLLNINTITNPTTTNNYLTTDLRPQNIKTKDIYVVGEKAPWLKAVRYTGDKDGVVITGERLLKVTKVYFAGQAISKENITWISDSELAIVPPTRVRGTYPIYTESIFGKSNSVELFIPGQISINSVSGPTTLNVNQTGTWSLTVTAPSDTALTYSVDWGEKGKCGADAKCLGLPTTVQQTSTFTHSYAQAGTYTVNFIVYAKGIQANSASLTVRVGTPDGVGKPVANFTAGPVTISKTLLNPTLNATFTGTITAVGGDVYVQKSYPFSAFFIKKETGNKVWTNSCSVQSNDYGVLPTTSNQYGNPLTMIKSGTSAKFDVSLRCPINEMFAGVYTAALTDLNYYLMSSDLYTNLPINVYSPNTQYIVGEKGPWVSSVVSKGETFILKGERLSKSHVYFNGGLTPVTQIGGSSEAITFSINEGNTLALGSYPVYVQNAVGKSNTVYYVKTENSQVIDELLSKVFALFSGVQKACGASPSITIPTNPTVAQLHALIATLTAQIQACSATSTSTLPVTVTPALSNLTTSDSNSTWTQGTRRRVSWQTTGSIPYVDVLLCAVGGSCYYSQKNIANVNNAIVSVVSTPVGSSIKIMVRETGKTSPSATSPNFIIGAPSTASTTVSQAKINELASVLNAIKALLAQMEGN